MRYAIQHKGKLVGKAADGGYCLTPYVVDAITVDREAAMGLHFAIAHSQLDPTETGAEFFIVAIPFVGE